MVSMSTIHHQPDKRTAPAPRLHTDPPHSLESACRASIYHQTQRCLKCSSASVFGWCAALARLSARFCLSVLPDFLVVVCRGDLSAIAAPLTWGAWSAPILRPYALKITSPI